MALDSPVRSPTAAVRPHAPRINCPGFDPREGDCSPKTITMPAVAAPRPCQSSGARITDHGSSHHLEPRGCLVFFRNPAQRQRTTKDAGGQFTHVGGGIHGVEPKPIDRDNPVSCR